MENTLWIWTVLYGFGLDYLYVECNIQMWTGLYGCGIDYVDLD